MSASGYRGILEVKAVRSIFIWFTGLLYFGLFCTIGILLSYFFAPRKFDPLIRLMLRGLLKIMFIKVKVEGLENIDSNKTYILMANHVSLFDVPMLKGYIPIYFVGIEAHHQFSWPLYGTLVKRLNTIPIQRDNIYSSMRSIKKAKKVLKDGVSVVILPEGHRTLDGKMRPFKKLPFRFLKDSNVDLIPIGLSGLFKLKPKKSWHIIPTTIKIKFGKAITKEQISTFTVDELRDLTFKQIQSLVDDP